VQLFNVTALVFRASYRSFFCRAGVHAHHIQRLMQLKINPYQAAFVIESSQLRCQGKQRARLLRCGCLLSKMAFLLAHCDALQSLRRPDCGIIARILKRCLSCLALQLMTA
jgi:hypothetical protein